MGRSWHLIPCILTLTLFAACGTGPRLEPGLRDYLGKQDWPQDWWHVAMPEDVGLDGSVLDSIREGTSDLGSDVHSFLVVRHGKLVYERYAWCELKRHQFTPDEVQPLYTSTRTVVASLVGTALDRGYLKSVDEPVLSWFPDLVPQNPDKRKADIRLRHLLTMTTGLAWTWQDHDAARASNDPTAWLMGRPLVAEPGTTWESNAACWLTLTAILEKAAGKGIEVWAREALFEPLGIQEAEWTREPGGMVSGDTGLKLRPRDMAKFGWLWLKGGTWEGRQILGRDWVTQATSEQATSNAGEPVGFGWWPLPDGQGFAANLALGQNICVLPGLDMVVVLTTDQDANMSTLTLSDVLSRVVLPAVLD